MNTTAKFNQRTIMAIESLFNLRQSNLNVDLQVETAMPWFFSSEYLSNPENISGFKKVLQANQRPQTLQDQKRQLNAIKKFDSRKWLYEIKAKTHIIAAEEDIVDLVSESQYLADHIPDANLTLIPGGHSSPVEQPKEVCEIVKNFFYEN